MTRSPFTPDILFAPSTPGVPDIVDLEPIHTCNFRCVMCHVSQETLTHKAIDIEALNRSIFSLDLKNKWVCIGATHEPCMHPQFDEIIHMLAFAGMKIDLTTNGSLFTDKLIDKIGDYPFARITISFDGATAGTYERIRRNADFVRTLSRVRAFKAAVGNKNTYWAVNYTVTRSSVDEIVPAVALWDSMGFDQIGFISAVKRFDSPDMAAEYMDEYAVGRMKFELDLAAHFVAERDLRITLGSSAYLTSDVRLIYPGAFDGPIVRSNNPDSVSADNCRPHYQLAPHPDVRVRCRSPYSAVRINYDGSVKLCFEKPVGNIMNNTLADIYNGPEAAALRAAIKRDVSICHRCDFYKFCVCGGEVDAGQQKNRVTGGGM